MPQITFEMPEELVAELDAAAERLNQTRGEFVRQATEAFLEDYDDLRIARERLDDPTDSVLGWGGVRQELVDSGQE